MANIPMFNKGHSLVFDIVAIKFFLFRLIIRFVIFCYTILMLQEAIPIFSDKIAHLFWPEYHMRVVHRINGKQHVHYEMMKGMAQDGKNKRDGIFKEDSYKTPYYPNYQTNLQQSLAMVFEKPLFVAYLCNYGHAVYGIDDPPPKY